MSARVRVITTADSAIPLYRASKKPPVSGICSGILSPLRGYRIAIVMDPWLAHMGYFLVAAPRLKQDGSAGPTVSSVLIPGDS